MAITAMSERLAPSEYQDQRQAREADPVTRDQRALTTEMEEKAPKDPQAQLDQLAPPAQQVLLVLTDDQPALADPDQPALPEQASMERLDKPVLADNPERREETLSTANVQEDSTRRPRRPKPMI
jgi:hypothetical protein